MKPTLTVLLGAGSTLNLGVTPPDAQPIGMPSTHDLTKKIGGMEIPAALRRSVPILLGPDEGQPYYGYTKKIPILPMIYHALTSEFDYVDFELILHAIEQLEPIAASIEDRRRVDRYRAVLSAFVEVNRKLDLLSDASLFLAIRPLIITKIYRMMIGPYPFSIWPIHPLCMALSATWKTNSGSMCSLSIMMTLSMVRVTHGSTALLV